MKYEQKGLYCNHLPLSECRYCP